MGLLAGGGTGGCGFVALAEVEVEEEVGEAWGGRRWGGGFSSGGGEEGRSLKGMRRVSMLRRCGDWGQEGLC